MNYYLKALNNYVNFTGRARRMEYWMFGITNLGFATLVLILDDALGTTFKVHAGDSWLHFSFGLFQTAYSLFIFLPSTSVAVRRLHDVGRSGWYLLTFFIPIAGWLWLLVVFFTAGDEGTNAYGPDPVREEKEGRF